MSTQEMHLQAIKCQGMLLARDAQQVGGRPSQWEMDSIVEQRDASKCAANDETLSPERRRVAAEFVALLDGWISAWG